MGALDYFEKPLAPAKIVAEWVIIHGLEVWEPEHFGASSQPPIPANKRGGSAKMEINAQVGETEGGVWHPLNSEGLQTSAPMEKKRKGTKELLRLALG